MKKALIAFLLVITYGVSYADMSSGFKEGEDFANSQAGVVVQDAKSLDPHKIPGFQTSNPSEEQYKNSNIDNAAKQQVNTNSAGNFVDKSYQQREHDKLDKNDPIVTGANNIVSNAQNIEKNSGSYCANGNCTDTHYQPSPDFNQAISALSATGAGSQDMSKHLVCSGPWFHRHCTYQYTIFDGSGMNCRIYWIGYDNCCADKGWGQDIGLAGCKTEEKQLGHKKEAGVCHYVGNYCSKYFHYVIGKTCIEHSKGYCCFNSKLARIVQEAGRQQLGEGWGSGKHPDCHGFTPEQLQKIDFSKINFSDFYGDIQNEMHKPDIPSTQGHIASEVQKDVNNGKPD